MPLDILHQLGALNNYNVFGALQAGVYYSQTIAIRRPTKLLFYTDRFVETTYISTSTSTADALKGRLGTLQSQRHPWAMLASFADAKFETTESEVAGYVTPRA